MTTSTNGRKTGGRPRQGVPANAFPAKNGSYAAAPKATGGPTTAGNRPARTENSGPMVGPRPRRRLTVRQWLALGLLTLVLAGLGGGAGWLVSQRLTPVYAAQAELLYSLTQEQPTGFLREDRNLSTQLVLLESRTVLAPAARENDVTVEELARALEASVVSESEVIQLRLTDASRGRAAAMLRSVVEQYLVASANTERAELRAYLEGQLQGVTDQIAALRPDPNRQGEIDALAQREQVLRGQLDEVRFTELAGAGAQVLVDPYLVAEPASPSPLITIGAGVTAALLIALLAVAVIARRMTRP